MTTPRLLLRASLIACCFLSPLAGAVIDCELNGTSINVNNGAETAGKSGLLRCRQRDGGELQREQELRDGKTIGATRYYSQGKLEQDFSVNDKGNKEGRYRRYDPGTGQLIQEETYRNGSTIGLSRSFTADGRPRRLTFYSETGQEMAYVEYTRNGKLRDLHCASTPVFGKAFDDVSACGFDGRKEAAVTQLYGDDDFVRQRVAYLQGKRTMREVLWDSNLKVRSRESVGSDGRETEQSFSQDGTKRREVQWVRLERGRAKVLEQEYHESDTLVREQSWATDGKPVSERQLYLNGQPRSEAFYEDKDDQQLRKVTEYHDNGKPAFKGSYLASDRYRQSPVGTHQRFDAEGRLRSETGYDARGRLNREKEWDESGKLTRDDAVFEDGSRKSNAPSR
jgi:antitoxin component YwqK of YwqJK toxin-antitoxin module